VGIHVTRITAGREAAPVQDDRLSAWDIALPVTFYPVGDQPVDPRRGVYAAQRLIFQTFEDRMTSQAEKGTLAAALLGVAARWRYVAVSGELNLAHTPSMSFANATFQGGWILLPMAGASVILPIGD
jgi:hypothetical protein